MSRRVLHYNWVQCDDPQGRGGGVSVYLRHLVHHSARKGDGTRFVLLSSGQHYTLIDRRSRYVRTPNAFEAEGVKSFRILNSPVKAPAHDMFYAVREWRTNRKIAKVFARLLRQEGPFDEVVFHSLEGISSEVLALREAFPQTRFVYMWHNYMPLCPQIELLYQMREDCRDFAHGLKCPGCLGGHHEVAALIRAQRLGSKLELAGIAGRPQGNFLFGFAAGLHQLARALRYFGLDLARGARTGFRGWRPARPGRRPWKPTELVETGEPPRGQDATFLARQGADYRLWREVNVSLLNGFDRHLAVSELVRDTIAGFGIEPARIAVAPLALDLHAAPAVMRRRFEAKPRRERTVIAFLGYAIPSKGLPFLTQALIDHPDPALKERAELVVYARLGPHQKMKLAPLVERLAGLRFVDGYRHEDLAGIARATDLGVAPSIWRETYNLVSYEMLCLGTPMLLSSTVGMNMFYSGKDDFVFRSGDGKDFVQKLAALVRDPRRIEAFFADPPELPDFAAHLSRIEP